MILANPYFYANKQGIPRLEADSVNITTTVATYNFSNHRYINYPFSGLVLFKLPTITAPSTAVPVVFNTNGKTQALTTLGGDVVTTASLNKSGIYLAYYENNTLQLLTGI